MKMFGRIRTRYPNRAGIAGYATTALGVIIQSFSFLCLYNICRYGGLIPGIYYMGWVLFPGLAYVTIQSVFFAPLSGFGIFSVYVMAYVTLLMYFMNFMCALLIMNKYGLNGQTFMHYGLLLPLFFMVAIAPGLPFQIMLLRDPWWKFWLPEPT